ncbi:hypothetical protein NBRC10513_007262 [Rhodotorula toruloides]
MTENTAANISSTAATARHAHDAPPDSPTPEPGAGGASTNSDHDEATVSGQRRISLLDLSDELLHRIFTEVLALEDSPTVSDSFGHIRVNKRIWRIGLPLWRKFITMEASSAEYTDSEFARLAQHDRLRGSVRQIHLLMTSDGPRRLALIIVAQLSKLSDLCLDFRDMDVSEHPIDTYLDIIGTVPLLERLRIETRAEIAVSERRSSFPSLRCLDVFGGSIARSILKVRETDLDKLNVTLFHDSAVPAIPWVTLTRLRLAGRIPSEGAAQQLLGPLDELCIAGKLESVRLSKLALDLSDTAKPIALYLISKLFTLVCRTRLRQLDLTTRKGSKWPSQAPEYLRMPGVQSLKVDELLSSDTSDIDRWKQLARLLSFFPDLRRLEVTGFSFNTLARKEEGPLSDVLTPAYVAQHFPVLAAILQYLRHRSAFREFCGAGWTISAAEHDMFLHVF